MTIIGIWSPYDASREIAFSAIYDRGGGGCGCFGGEAWSGGCRGGGARGGCGDGSGDGCGRGSGCGVQCGGGGGGGGSGGGGGQIVCGGEGIGAVTLAGYR